MRYSKERRRLKETDTESNRERKGETARERQTERKIDRYEEK